MLLATSLFFATKYGMLLCLEHVSVRKLAQPEHYYYLRRNSFYLMWHAAASPPKIYSKMKMYNGFYVPNRNSVLQYAVRVQDLGVYN